VAQSLCPLGAATGGLPRSHGSASSPRASRTRSSASWPSNWHSATAVSRRAARGALATLAEKSFGTLLLLALVLGFAAYALWRVAQALFEREEDDSKLWAKRVGYAARAAVYFGLTYSCVKIAFGSHAESQNETARKTTAQILGWPGGTWLVALGGACIAGVGLYNGYRALTCSFAEKWDTSRMQGDVRRWATRIGVVGLLSRLVVLVLVGDFAIKAAVEYEPKEAIGLDGALQKLTQETYGPWLLGLTAAGLVAYALYCFADARYRKV
jgi:hypothetical protein